MSDTDTEVEVQAYIDAVPGETRRRDAKTLLELMRRATGETPRLEGSIIAFGNYHYKYASGREGDTAPAGFSPRKASTSIYLLDGIAEHTEQLSRLGEHTSGVGCLFIKDLEKVDLAVLEQIVAECYNKLTDGAYELKSNPGKD
jgi:hypothetical protein